MMFVTYGLTVTRRAIRISTRRPRAGLVGLRAVLVLIAVWFTVVRDALGVARRRAGVRSRVGTDLVLIFVSISITVAATLGGTIRIATGRVGTGLLRFRTVLVLVAVRLTVTQGTVGVATGRPKARLIGLWAMLVLVTDGLTTTFRAF
jgi:hypothetical protein